MKREVAEPEWELMHRNSGSCTRWHGARALPGLKFWLVPFAIANGKHPSLSGLSSFCSKRARTRDLKGKELQLGHQHWVLGAVTLSPPELSQCVASPQGRVAESGSPSSSLSSAGFCHRFRTFTIMSFLQTSQFP